MARASVAHCPLGNGLVIPGHPTVIPAEQMCGPQKHTPKNIKPQQEGFPREDGNSGRSWGDTFPKTSDSKPSFSGSIRWASGGVFIWMSDGYAMPRSDENIIIPWLLRCFKAFGHGRGSYWDRPVMVTDVYPTVANQGLGLGFSIL